MSEPIVETRRTDLPGGHWVEVVVELDLSGLDGGDMKLTPRLRGLSHSVGLDAATAAATGVSLVRAFSEDVVRALGVGRVGGAAS